MVNPEAKLFTLEPALTALLPVLNNLLEKEEVLEAAVLLCVVTLRNLVTYCVIPPVDAAAESTTLKALANEPPDILAPKFITLFITFINLPNPAIGAATIEDKGLSAATNNSMLVTACLAPGDKSSKRFASPLTTSIACLNMGSSSAPTVMPSA